MTLSILLAIVVRFRLFLTAPTRWNLDGDTPLSRILFSWHWEIIDTPLNTEVERNCRQIRQQEKQFIASLQSGECHEVHRERTHRVWLPCL